MKIFALIFLTFSFIGPHEDLNIKIDRVWKTPYIFNTLEDCKDLEKKFKENGVVTDCLEINKDDINGRR